MTIGIRKNIIKEGDVFGRWTVVREDSLKTSHTIKRRIICRCICGTEKSVSLSDLMRGSSTSCGCFQKESARNQMIIHGMCNTPEHETWHSMGQRCNNKKHKNYKDYSGRGITICKEWKKFENFFKDMGIRPKGASLDRKDNNKGYCKENCKWSTPKEQALNRRNNNVMALGEKSLCQSQWSDNLGFGRTVIGKRLKNGWSKERALTVPLINSPVILSWNGKTMNMLQW
jgi:hypothetical protein